MDYAAGMNELEMASRAELIALIHAQQATIAELQATVAHLEQRVRELESGRSAPQRMPGHKPEQAEPRPKRPRRKRTENHARRRSTRPRRSGTPSILPSVWAPSGRWGRQAQPGSARDHPGAGHDHRHVYLERCCPGLRSTLDTTGRPPGPGRWPVTLWGRPGEPDRHLARGSAVAARGDPDLSPECARFALSVGGIVGAFSQVARVGSSSRQQTLAAIRASPVIYADETGWREDGVNRYLWTVATPDRRYFTFGGRGKAIIDEVLGIDTARKRSGCW